MISPQIFNQEDEEKNRHYLAYRIKESKNLILKNWEGAVRQSLTSTENLNSQQIQNSIPELLDHIVSLLSQDDRSQDPQLPEEIALDHGQQRARLVQYDIPQVMREYQIFRQILFLHLDSNRELIHTLSRRIIFDAIDDATTMAVQAFAEYRSLDLKRSHHELEHFATIAAHDLKSPLATMQGYLDLLADEPLVIANDKLKKPIAVLQKSVSRMSMMITSLLDYSKIETKMKPFQAVPLQEAVNRAWEGLEYSVQESNAKLSYDPLPVVHGDLPLLTQVFQNLFSNAIKFRKDLPPFIQIRVRLENSDWHFIVEDNGIGFDPNKAEVMFQLFQQLSAKNKEQGSGIGLATCRKVIELHGGKIWAESKKDHGSQFHFTLPSALVQ